VTVLIAADQLPASALLEVREACNTLGLATAEWTGGIPRVAPLAVISGLDHGVRRIPDDLMALLEAIPGLQLVLCAQEPLVKPWIVIGDGRVCVLGPPIGRTHITAALRAAILPPATPRQPQMNRRFEVLRRSHWIAWARGRSGPAISLHEQRGATVVIGGATHDRSAIADVMTSAQRDADRESALAALAGKAGVAHLTQDASEWVMYWPIDHCQLWLYSPDRIPTRWNAARGIAAVADRRLLRLPAFPADQLVAAWSETPIGTDTLAPVQRRAAEGGSETILGLDDIAGCNADVTGLVMEVR
jgi:hypothetical protein